VAFSWTAHKYAGNLVKHGVSFEEAQTVFDDPLAYCFPDPEHSIGEERYILVGYSNKEQLLFVSHQDLGENIRIISARTATPFERKRHENNR
jgi:uncharacterized DUF497 family protein